MRDLRTLGSVSQTVRQKAAFSTVLTAVLAAVIAVALACGLVAAQRSPEDAGEHPERSIPEVDDFELTGDGSNAAWKAADWNELARLDGTATYTTRFKVLASESGVYFLIDGTDSRLTATATEDFADLWKEDVFEIFLWTDERYPIYFEYEISPLGRELPILVPNFDGRFLGWRPWHYEGDRRTRKAVHVTGGAAEPGAKIAGWTAEVFIPFELLRPLENVPPRKGGRWRANVYRIDHDGGATTRWAWAKVGESFHAFRDFGTLVFSGR